ncbi:LIRP [Ceratitis capitata]|uniref:LIRP n=1 Tax=Ceratitis capitata TaxID=7213 RepID=W8CAN1_CERCA|nr:LIRP [Ceratitis capitata]
MSTMNLIKICTLLTTLLVCVQRSACEQSVCGPALDSVLSTICENGFNTKFKKSLEWDDLGKNDLDKNYLDTKDLDDEMIFPYAAFPFLAKIHGGQVDTVAKSRRRREGVYDECCRKPCKMSELRAYCK